MSCTVCNYSPLGDPDSNLHDRLATARAGGSGGCIHQATDLLVTLLRCAAVLGTETKRDEGETMASVILSTAVVEGEDEPVFEAAFISSNGEKPLVVRRGAVAVSPAQAAINLLIEIHDAVLLELKAGAVSH